jgi:hypothetical protein
MQRILWTALLALPFCVPSAHAQCYSCNSGHCCLNCVNNPYFPMQLSCGPLACVCGERKPPAPWYLYFPPEPTGPALPATSFIPVMPRYGHINVSNPIWSQPTSYSSGGSPFGGAPSYWYGH